MSITELPKLGAVKRLLAGRSDDTVDKLHHSSTTTLLLVLATVLTTGIFVGDPIQCWLPAEFPPNREAYVKQHCWIKNTYYIPLDDLIPIDVLDRTDAEVTYYQWIPMILLFMALLFKLPYMLWRHCHRYCGVNISRLSELTDGCIGATKASERDDRVSHLADVIGHWLSVKNANTNTDAKRNVKTVYNGYRQTFLIRLYIFTKALYLFNVIGQLYLLKLFLDMDFPKLGYDLVHIFGESTHWIESRRFPRLTLCDFQIRQLQNVQRYTVQCVLPINLFNEKIFILLWFWLLMMAVCTGISLLWWLWCLLYRRNNFQNINNYLKLQKVPKDRIVRIKRHLGDDGCFVLRLVSLNCDSLAVKYLLDALMKKLHPVQTDL